MAEYTKDDALAFIEAMRLTLNGKVGFSWLVDRLAGLSSYIESITLENERLNTLIDSTNAKCDYESSQSPPSD